MASFFEWLKNSTAVFSKQKDDRGRLEHATFPRVYDSQLEDRRVLNAGAVVTAIDLVSLRFDAGQSAMDGVADKFELSRLDSSSLTNQIAVSINDQRVWQGNAAEIQSIHFDGSSDADQFYIDPTIQIAAGIFIDGTAIATHSQSEAASDVIVFASLPETHFDEITYQTRDAHIQVHFVSTAGQLNTLVQIQNVESIRDLNSASERAMIANSTGGGYTLKDSGNADTAGRGQTVQWISSQNRIEFEAPTNRLTIDLRSAMAGRDTLIVESFNHAGVEHFSVLGDETDYVRLAGDVTTGLAISVRAGTIGVDGTLSTASSGKIRLDAGSGTLNVNGGILSLGDDVHHGGDIVLAGDHVLLHGSTRVDVSGGTGGGRIRVGGGYQGKDVSVHNSRYTSVSPNATLNADARINGNGGIVIVWSDDTSIIEGSGNIFARGGIEGGDGGFIETSGKRYLRINGAASTFANRGQSGNWLIDPDDIEIVTVAGAAPNTSYVLISTIVTGLAGGNITIVTNTPSGGDGDIRIVDALSLAPTTSRTLTLDATRDIVFLSDISGNANLQVNLISGRDVDSTAVSIGQLNSLSINAARNINVGTIDLSGGTLTATIDSNNDDADATFQSTGALSAGAISISGSSTVNDAVTLGSTVTTTTGAIQFSQISNLTFQGDVTAATNVTFSSITGQLALGSNADVTANNGPLDFLAVTSGILFAGSNGSTNILTAKGATGGLTLGSVTATNSNVGLTLSSATNTSVGSVNLQNGTLTSAIDSDDNNVGATFQSTGALSAGAISISGSSTVNDAVTLGSTVTTTTAAIQFSQISNLTFQGDVTAATNVTFSSITGQLALGSNADVTANNGPLDFLAVTSGILLAGSNGSTNILTAKGATGGLTLGSVTATNSNVGLTLSSATNTSVGSVNLQNGTLTSAIDSDDNNVGATFQSTGALSAGAISISGSSTVNDAVTLGSTVTTTTGAIQFSQISNLTFQGDVTAATNVTFSSITGQLALGSNADVTANNGPLDFLAVTSGILLAGSNGSTNILTAQGATGGLTLGSVTATNSNVGLTLSSATNTSVGSVNLQNGTLTSAIDSDDNNVGATFQSTGALSAGAISISGSSTVNDAVTLGSTVTTTTAAIQFSQISNLTFQGDVTAATNVTFSSITGQLALGSNADVTANNGPLDFLAVTSGILLAGSNGSTNILTAQGATGGLTLGSVTATNSNVGLTLSSATNTSVGSVNLQNGTLTSAIDSDDNNVGATFQSTGALSAGAISISGSSTVNDAVTLGSTVTTTTAAIQFSQISNLTFQGDVTAATNVTFSSITGQLALGSNADVTANNGPLDFLAVTSGILLAGSNGSTNILTAQGATGGLTLGSVTATNSNVGLTLSSATNTSVGSVNLQNGTLTSAIDSDDNNVGATFQSTGALSAGAISISGSSTVNDAVTLGSTVTTTTGAIQFSQISNLTFQGDVTAATNVTFSSITGQLALGSNADVTANNGPLDFLAVTSGILLAGSNGSTNILTAQGATGGLTLGSVTATNSNVGLTLSSATNTSVGSVNLQNGTLTSAIDSDDNNVGATFQSTGALSAGAISISGSSTVNDAVTLGSTVTTTTGAIQFSQISNLTFQGDVTAATNVTFSSITGQLALGSNADVTANNGPINFTSIVPGILLTGANGSTNVITAIGTTGSLSLATASATNANVSLTLNGATDVNAENINIQSGNLLVTYSGQNVASANVATFKKVTAGSLTVSGNSRTDDQTVLTDTLTIGVGGVTIDQFADLKINAAVNSSGGVTTLGISGSQTHLTADVTSNGGAISMTGGTLFIDGSAPRTISSRGGAVAVGGNIVLGNVDGENGAANLNVDSRGTSTAGSVSIGAVTAATSGLNRLNIRTDATTTAGQVILSSIRLVEKSGTAATLAVASGGNAIRANGVIDLSSNGVVDGGSIDFGASEVTPTNASSTLILNTSNVSAIGGNGGDIKFAGVSNNGANYLDSVLIDTSTANAAKSDGDLDFNGKANPKIAVDGPSGTGISLIGTIVKAFSGVLSFLTNPAGASANSSSIDVSRANFQSTAGLKFDTFGGASTNAGDVVLGDIGVSAANRPASLTVDTRGTATSGDLLLDDGSGASTELHVAGDLNLANAKIKLTDSALLRTYGTGSMTLGDLATVGGVARNLTLNSEANITVSAINLTGGSLTANVDSNDDNIGSTFVSTGALSAGTVSILGSASNNDNVTINSSLNTTTGAIQFAQVDKLVFNGDVTSQTSMTFTNVIGLSLGANADVTANNGPLDFSTVTSALQLVGSNGSTNILTSRGTTGSLTLGTVTTTNPNVSLTLSSATNTTIGSINIQNGALSATIDSDNNDINASFMSTGALTAGSVAISGSTTVNDRVTLGSTVTTTIGAIQVTQFEDLRINGDWTTAGGVTTTGVSASQTHLAANITSNGGNVSMTGGTLLINGTTVRQIKSGGASVNAINGGFVTLGIIDGEVAAADLEIDSRGSSTSGGVTLGNITNAAGNTGLNRLNIQTDGAAPGQVSLSNIRLIAKNATPASLTVTAGGRTILADGTIDLSSNVNGRAGGRINFGTSVVAPKSASSTLVINTSNSNATSGVDGSDGGDVLLGGIGVNATSATFFDSVTIDLSAADILDAAGTLRFGTVANPSIQVDGVLGTGIRIAGRVDNAAGKVLSLSTNPAGASQNTSAIDVSKTTYIGSGGLNFDTSGSNQSLTSGSITLGDIGAIVRPVSLVVNTRGAVSSGHLILNDTVVGSATEIRIDGTIDFSDVTVDLLDDALLESHLDGNSILLGTTNAVGGARNLQLASDSGITVAAMNLAGGAFQANVDLNNNEVGSFFRSTGTIAAGSFAAAGSAANNDIASIGAGVTATGSVSFSNFDQLRIQALINAGTTFVASSIVGAVDFSGTSGIAANGSIDLRTSVNAIKLSGVAGNTTLIDAKGNNSVVTLATVTATNPGTRLNVRSDYGADLQNVEMLTGTLDVQIGRSTTLTDATARLRQVNAGGLVVAGTSTANDAAVLDGALNIGTNGSSIQNLAKLDVNFNVQSVGDINATNILNRIQVAEAVAIQSNQSMELQTNVGRIQLVGIHGLTNTFRADGDSSSLKLGAIQALGNVVLVLSSANDISVASIEAVGSNLSIEVDNNDNTNGSQLVAGQIQAKQISIRGGADRNDVAVFNGLLESNSRSLLVTSFGTINLKGDVLSSSGLELSEVSGRVNIDAGRLVKAANGNVVLNNRVGAIRFLGGAGTSSSIQAVNGNLLMSDITELNTSDLIELRADRDVILAASSLNSRLRVVAGDHNSNFGSINASAALTAGAIDLQSASGIGTSGAVATSTSVISATNRLGGVVQIANSKAGAVTVSNLTANQGGNIFFTQSGGGDVRFQQVTSNADGTPAVNESDIRLTSIGSGLIVDGNGVSAGGLGNVVMQTQNSGDVQLLAATRTNGGTLAVQSAQRIIGSGTLSSRQVDLNATSGIGTTGAIQTQTSQLRLHSQSESLNVQNSSVALTTVSQLTSGGNGTVHFNQVGGGDVAFLNVATGSTSTNAGSDVNLRNSSGSVLVQGSVVAGGGGSIRFDAQNNLFVGAGALVQTNGVNATISGNSGGQFQFTPGAALRAGSSNANTEAIVTVLPPLVSVRPTVNSIGVNVDSEGFATLQIQLGSASPALIDRNFSVVIDWGDKQIDQFPNGTISPSTTNPQIARFDGSGVIYQITHQYQGNPNPLDPIADIPVKVTVGVDALNRIQFNDSKGPVTSLSNVVNQSLVTPAAGLISLRFDLPQAPTIPNRIVFNNSGVVQSASSIAPVATSAETSVSSSSSAAEKGRSYVLRIITPVNEQGEVASSEDIELTVKDIEDLSTGKLFQKLGDNRYRIYLIREDGNELLLKDFYLRNHRPFEVEDSPASSNEMPVEERVLDQPSAALTGDDHALEFTSEKSEVSEFDMQHNEEMNGELNEERIPITNAALAVGTFAQRVRSWRKAARRFRAG